MSKKARHPFAQAFHRGGRSAATRPLPASHTDDRHRTTGGPVESTAAGENELTIELLKNA
jgi:hypothetical protein